jgi:tetratricopeptide (TPR) repeat protein
MRQSTYRLLSLALLPVCIAGGACRTTQPEPCRIASTATLQAAEGGIDTYTAAGYRKAIRTLEPLARCDDRLAARLAVAYGLLAHEQKDVGLDNLTAWTSAAYYAAIGAASQPGTATVKAKAIVLFARNVLTESEYRSALEPALDVTKPLANRLAEIRSFSRYASHDREAAELLDGILQRRDPGDDEARLWRWWIDTPGDTESNDAKALLQRFPEHPLMLFEIGRQRVREGRYVEAEEVFTRLTAKATHARAFAELGQLALNRNDISTAGAQFERALALEPELPTALLARGSLAWETGRNAQAEHDWARAHQLTPTWEDPIYNSAVLRLSDYTCASAAEDLDELVALHGRFEAWAYTHKALCAIEEGHDDAAAGLAGAALIVAPNDDAPEYILGLVAYRANRMREAEKRFQRAVALNAENAEAHLYLGELYLKERSPREAHSHASAAIELFTARLTEIDLERERVTAQGRMGTGARLEKQQVGLKRRLEQASALLARAPHRPGDDRD